MQSTVFQKALLARSRTGAHAFRLVKSVSCWKPSHHRTLGATKMAKSSDTHDLSSQQMTRCKRQIALATAAAVIVAAFLWFVAVRLGLAGS
jgi:hypothetical protein